MARDRASRGGLDIAFKAGAVTGMLVAGLALLAVSVYYFILVSIGATGRGLIDPLVALGFGASLIPSSRVSAAASSPRAPTSALTWLARSRREFPRTPTQSGGDRRQRRR